MSPNLLSHFLFLLLSLSPCLLVSLSPCLRVSFFLDGNVSSAGCLADLGGWIVALQLGQGGDCSIGTSGRAHVGDDLEGSFARLGVKNSVLRSPAAAAKLAFDRSEQSLDSGFADLNQHRGDFFDALLDLAAVAFGVR